MCVHASEKKLHGEACFQLYQIVECRNVERLGRVWPESRGERKGEEK